MLTRAYEILEPHFVESVLPEEGHGLLSTRASWTKLLMTLPKQANTVAAKFAGLFLQEESLVVLLVLRQNLCAMRFNFWL